MFIALVKGVLTRRYGYRYSKYMTIAYSILKSFFCDRILSRILNHESCHSAFEDRLDTGKEFKSFIVRWSREQMVVWTQLRNVWRLRRVFRAGQERWRGLFPLSYEITSLGPLPTDHLLNIETPVILTVLYLNSLNVNNIHKTWTSKICSLFQMRRYDVEKQVHPDF